MKMKDDNCIFCKLANGEIPTATLYEDEDFRVILDASLSTSREIFTGTVFKFESGVHFENYASAWKGNNVSVYFANSLLYAVSSCIVVILISAPAAYVLSRFTFLGNKGVKTGLILAMSIPEVMIIMPIYSLTAQYHIRGRILLIILYILLRVPFTTTYLLNFFASLSRRGIISSLGV